MLCPAGNNLNSSIVTSTNISTVIESILIRALNRHKSTQKTGIDWMANLKNSNRLDDDF